MPSQRITPGTSTLVIRLVDHELSDDGDGGDVVFHDKAKRTQQGDLLYWAVLGSTGVLELTGL